MSWKEDLNKKEKELHLQKEEINVRTRSNSNIGSDRSNDSRLLISESSRKSINNVTEKEEKKMITVEGALSDIDKLIEEATQAGDKVSIYLLKAQKVMIKFLSTMRSNQLLTEDDKKRIAVEKAKRAPKVPQQ